MEVNVEMKEGLGFLAMANMAVKRHTQVVAKWQKSVERLLYFYYHLLFRMFYLLINAKQ